MRWPLRNAAIIAATALLGISSLSPAQVGGSRSAQRNNNDPYDVGIAGPPPVARAVAALVLERAAELALADNQNIALETIRRAQDSANAPRLKTLDSLRPTRRPANGVNDLSPEQREEIGARRDAVLPVLEAIRETNANARIKVMALLNPDQQKRAAEWEKEAQKQAEEEGRRHARDAFGAGPQRTREGGRARPPED